MKQRPEITRVVPVLDLEVSGRTVTAYAATFGDPYEVADQYGHYDEVIHRTAFNRALGHGFAHVRVLYNHGRTVGGTEWGEFSKPLGTPVEIRPDARGLLTVTRYNATPLADEVLEMINSGSITHQSFRGSVYRSAPARPGANGRPLIERLVLGLTEYGPGVFAFNPGAEIVAVRSMSLTDDEIVSLEPDERRDLIARLQQTLPSDPSAEPDSPVGEPAADAAPPGRDLSLLITANAQRRRH